MTTPRLGRSPDAGRWMRRAPVASYIAILLALLMVGLSAHYRYAYVWTPLQRAYLTSYLTSGVVGIFRHQPVAYPVLFAADQRRSWMAADAHVTADGHALVPNPVGAFRLEWRRVRMAPQVFKAWLVQIIYGGQTLTALAVPALRDGLITLAFGLLFAIPRDVARLRERRGDGRILQGTERLTVKQMNARVSGEAVPIALADGSTALIPLKSLMNHGLVGGDTATGKSTVIRNMLAYCEVHGITAVVNDPECEFTSEFYRPERGDVILNPTDERCPYWTPAFEVGDPAEAMAVAESFFPEPKAESSKFFTRKSKDIFCYLMGMTSDADGVSRPSPHEIVTWMSDWDRLLAKVLGTPLQAVLQPKAHTQNAGIIASLNDIAGALSLLPASPLGRRSWSVREWARDRQGWVFITSSPATQASQLPLTTMWIDAIILRLMTDLRGSDQSVLLFLDELASLKEVGQLREGFRRLRKRNASIVAGFQSKSDVEDIYGNGVLSMLSQTKVKLFFGTSEPQTAEWVADTLAKVETERITARREEGVVAIGDAHYDMPREQEHVVMQSVIQNMPDLTAFLKWGGAVAPLRLAYLKRPIIADGYVPRSIERCAQEEPTPVDVTEHYISLGS